MAQDVKAALRGKLAHDDLRVYNAAQRAAQIGAIVLGIVLVVSGLVIWKPVQFRALGYLIGDYEGARPFEGRSRGRPEMKRFPGMGQNL